MPLRRLSAVLFSDIKGFSSRMRRDEEGTWRLLQVHNAVVEGEVANLGGRVVKTVGDAYMVEFGSSVLAVRCALNIQQALASHNRHAAGGDRIDVRIGVHAGDVLVDGDDLFGEVVNLAARLEAQAPTGAVCVTREVLAQVSGKVRASVEALGPRSLKNMGTLELFALRPADVELAGVPEVSLPAPVARRRRPVVPALVALGAVGLTVALAWGLRPDAEGVDLRVGYHGALDDAPGVVSGFSQRIESCVIDTFQELDSRGEPVDGAVRIRVEQDTQAVLSLAEGVYIAPHPCLPEGRAATADDIVHSLERVGELLLPIDSVERRGDEVVIRWERPNVYARRYLAGTKLVGRLPESCDPDAPQAGTSSLYLESQTAGGVVTLRVNPRRWRDDPVTVSSVTWEPVASSAEALRALAGGSLDLYFPTYSEVLAETEERDGGRVLARAVPGVAVGRLAWAEALDVSMRLVVLRRPGSPLSDPRVRRAMAWGVDREALTGLPSYGAPRGRLLTRAMLGFDAMLEPYVLDRERARASLAESGLTPPVPIVLGHPSGGIDAARALALQLGEVGFSVEVVELTNAEIGRLLEAPKVDAWLSGAGNPVTGADPTFLLGSASLLEAMGGEVGLNELADSVAAERDRIARGEGFARLERVLLDDASIIPLAEREIADGAGGSTVYYGPRLAPQFDGVGRTWSSPQDWARVRLAR